MDRPERPQLATALILCLAVTLVYINFIRHKEEAHKKQSQGDGALSGKEEGEGGGDAPPPPGPEPDASQDEYPLLPEGQGSSHRVEVSDSKGRKKYIMHWSERGAALASLRLADYYESGFDRRKADPTEADYLRLFGNVPSHYPAFAVDAPDLDLAVRRWKRIDDGKDPSILEFQCRARSLEVTKSIDLDPEAAGDWKFQIRLTVRNLHSTAGKWTFTLYGPPGIQRESGDEHFVHGFYAEGNEPHALDEESIVVGEFEDDYEKGSRSALNPEAPLSWTGVANKYFAVCLAIPTPAETAASAQAILYGLREEDVLGVEAEKPAQNVRCMVQFLNVEVPAGSSREIVVDVHAGPNEILARDPRFEELDDYFAVSISHMLIAILRFFHSWVGNWGVAILMLTFFVKVCLFPLTRKAQKAMHVHQQKMKKFMPKLQAIREKYKDNPRDPRAGEEQMALFRQHGINPVPVGGCLPMLIQMPIMIGLFNALRFAIDLRQAPFLYIPDLSQPDRLYELPFRIPFLGPDWESTPYLNILPLIMIVTWFYQQKLMPKSDDPQIRQQQQMMQVMPIIMGLMFYSVASGLVVYWLLSTALGILEQLYIRRELAPVDGEVPAVEEAPGKKARGGKKPKK